MPYIAIIHVPDHTTAQRVIERFEHGDSGTIVGLFDFPERKQLKCSGSCVTKGTGSFSRDPRGFMKCNVCGFRHQRLRRFLIEGLFDWFGANLYSKAPGAFRTPEGYGSPR